MGSNTRFGLAALCVLLVSLAAEATAQSENEIGVAAAVNPQAEGTPPAAESRTLQVGVNVLADERIVTSAGGQAQMLFLDESAFTVGPNSDVVLDEFVFDPDTGTGRIALTAAKGVFRLVGGKISKRTPVTLKTPTAVIGIRGGIALVNVAPNGATQATFLFGDQMTVGTAGGAQAVSRPGFTVSADDPDAPPSNPTPATPAQLNAALGGLEGSAPPPPDGGEGGGGDGGGQGGGGGQAAGGGQVPTDQNVADSGIGELGSSNNPDALAGSPPPPPPTLTAGGAPDSGVDATTEAQQNKQLQSSDNLGTSIAGNFVGRITHATRLAGPTSPFGLDLEQSGLDKPFQTASVSGGTFTATLSSSSTFSAPLSSGTTTGITALTNPFGSGTLTGTSVLFPDNEYILYELTDSGDGHRVLAFAGIPTTTFPTSGATFYKARDDFILGSKVFGIPAADGGNLSITQNGADAAIYWDTSQSTTAQRPFAAFSGGVTGTGASQQMAFSLFVGQVVNGSNGERIVQGGFGGFSLLTGDGTSPRLFDGDFESICNCDNTVSTETEHYFFGKDEPDHFIISSGDVPNSSAVAPFERRRGIETVQTYHPAINFNRTTETLGTRSAHLASTTGTSFNRQLTGWVAGVGVSVNQSSGALAPFSFTSKTVDPNGVKIQTDPNSNKVAAAFDMTKSSGGGDLLFVTLGDDDSSFGTSPATNGHSAFLDDKTFGATVDCTSATCASTVTFNSVTAADGALAIATLDNVPGLDGTYANCSYCSWGLIAGEIEPSSPSTFERLLGFWTAGAVQDFAQIPTAGSASYGGHMVAFVEHNGAQYIEHGNATFSVNFSGASSNGTLTVTNFDGGGLTGSFSAIGANSPGHSFTGSVSGTGALSGVSGSHAGSFFTNQAGNAVAGVGGKVFGSGTVGGNPYRFAGVHVQTCSSGTCQ